MSLQYQHAVLILHDVKPAQMTQTYRLLTNGAKVIQWSQLYRLCFHTGDYSRHRSGKPAAHFTLDYILKVKLCVHLFMNLHSDTMD